MVTTVKYTEEQVDVELTHTNLGESNYVAMAFSDDAKMGKDLVFACNYLWDFLSLFTGIKVFWNPGNPGTTPSERQPDQDRILIGPSSRDVDGSTVCKFSLNKDVTIQDNKFDLHKGHHILVSTGPGKSTKLEYHNENKIASTSKFGKDLKHKGNEQVS